MNKSRTTRIIYLLAIFYAILGVLVLFAGCGSGNPVGTDEIMESPNAGPTVSLFIVNHLFSPIEIRVGDRLVGTVSRVDSAHVDVSSIPGVSVTWSMVPVKTTAGQKLGTTLRGSIAVQGGNQRLEITNVIGGEKYFGLLIGNSTSRELLYGINMGLSPPENRWEEKCYCPLSPQSPLTYVGYYRLMESTSIRVYSNLSDYSGPYDTWLRFSDGVDSESGLIILTVYAVPAGKTRLISP